MKQVAVYYRVSTGKQDLRMQEGAVKAFLKRQGIIKKQVIEFKDEGVSGKLKSRPEFDRMMRFVRAGKIDTVVCYKLDRLARSAMQGCRVLLELLDEHQLKVCCVKDELLNHLAPNEPCTPIIVAVIAAFAQIEHKQIGDRTREGQLRAKARGVHIGRPKRSSEEEAEVLRLRHEEKLSYPQIGKRMGISTAKAFKIVKEDQTK